MKPNVIARINVIASKEIQNQLSQLHLKKAHQMSFMSDGIDTLGTLFLTTNALSSKLQFDVDGDLL